MRAHLLLEPLVDDIDKAKNKFSVYSHTHVALIVVSPRSA
jgi:hypothetical protein